MTSKRLGIAIVVAGLAFHAACTDTESATNLNPSGPPMIEQVIMNDSTIDMMGNEADATIFAFGTLPGVDPAMEHTASSAAVAAQRLRIIFDEVLKGNRLEEIKCRANVGADGFFARIPDGTTPDDIAKCTTAQDVLVSTCTGDHAVCLCDLDGGCIVGTDTVAKGKPVGVLDDNQDGAADTHRFIPTAVALKCGTITVPADPAASYWYPSGDQLPPASGGINELGPAVVFIPGAVIPTNTTCSLVFADDIVDKTDIRVCAPMGGRTTACSTNLDLCSQTCTPGDVSAFSFKTAPLAISTTFAPTGNDKGTPLIFVANNLLDMASLTAAGTVTMTQNGTAFNGFTVTLSAANGRALITLTPTSGMWLANATYTVTFTTALKDAAGVPLPAPVTFTVGIGA
jgi:Bacterial Ig-like domain